MVKSNGPEGCTETEHMLGEGAAKIGRIAAGIITSEGFIEFALSGAIARSNCYDQRCIYCYYGISASDLQLNPFRNFIDSL
jgi:hypothetical protein